jgi:hypothetical protein
MRSEDVVMRRAALLLCLVTACSTYRGSVKTAQVGGLMVLGGIAAGLLVATQTDEPQLIAAPVAIGAIGIYPLVGGLIGMLVHAGDLDEEPRKEPIPGRVLATRKRVRGMSPEEHERCLEARRRKLLAAQQIDDRKRRGAIIASISACGEIEEVTVEVSAETGETAEEQIVRREHAWAQTKRAGEAARAGDCATVLAIGREVYTTDPEFHDTVFARDVAIARCVWPEPATPAP